MSIDVSTRVWQQSKQSGTALLVLLALADRASEDGYAYPGLEWIAERARVDVRQVRRLVRDLERRGDLYSMPGRGRSITSGYLVCVGLTADQIASVLVKRFDLAIPEAMTVAKTVTDRQLSAVAPPEKPDIGVNNRTSTPPFMPEENRTFESENRTSESENRTSERENRTSTPPNTLLDVSDPLGDDDTRALPTPTASSSSSSSLSSPPAAAPGTTTAYAQIVELYENNIGLVTTITSQAIQEALGRYPPEWLAKGIEIAVKRERRDWRYIEGILRNWETEGFGGNGNGKRSSSTNNRNGKPNKDPNRYAALGYDFSDDVVLVDGEPYSPSQ